MYVLILIVVVKIINCKLIGYGINDILEMIMINNLIFDKECYVLGIFYDWYKDVLSINWMVFLV